MRINAEIIPIMHDCVATGVVAGKYAKERTDAELIVEILVRNRVTGVMRKIREKYAEKDMRKITELMRKIKKDEAMIEVRLNAEPLF